MRLPGEDCQERTARTGLLGKGCQHRAARIRQPGRTERRGQPKKDSQNITASTGYFSRRLYFSRELYFPRSHIFPANYTFHASYTSPVRCNRGTYISCYKQYIFLWAGLTLSSFCEAHETSEKRNDIFANSNSCEQYNSRGKNC